MRNRFERVGTGIGIAACRGATRQPAAPPSDQPRKRVQISRVSGAWFIV